MTCLDRTQAVEERIDEVLTRYRESPNLLFLLRTYLGAAVDTYNRVCDLPAKFDLNTAVGDQLTIVGKRLGFPRCHCVCSVQPVFGFECVGYNPAQPIAGFCDDNSTWAGCGEFGTSDICINDDELYRKFLKVRALQASQMFDAESLDAAVVEFWGPTAKVMYAGLGRVVVAPGRDLTQSEISVLQLYPRVLPVALGVEVRFHFGSTYVFGFGEGWGGFCEPEYPDGLPLLTHLDAPLETEDDLLILTGPLTDGATWLCHIDVRPYSC